MNEVGHSEWYSDEEIKKMYDKYGLFGKVVCPVCGESVLKRKRTTIKDGLNKQAVKKDKLLLEYECRGCNRKGIMHRMRN
ncbi:MAG: hypothetical protein HQL29_01880 [Candidatus Omnitrophica bacterium]|nr:hypothetical protein [Candidatus Omnitrophota bacterium]